MGQGEGEDDKTVKRATMHHWVMRGRGGEAPAGAAESSRWRRWRREAESVSESRQAGTVAMAQIAGAPRKLRKEEHERCGGRWGVVGGEPGGLLSPSSSPNPDSQRASMPSGTHRWLAPRWVEHRPRGESRPLCGPTLTFTLRLARLSREEEENIIFSAFRQTQHLA